MEVKTTTSNVSLPITAVPTNLTLTDTPISVSFCNSQPGSLAKYSIDAGNTWEYLRPGIGITLYGTAATSALFAVAGNGSGVIKCQVTQEASWDIPGAYDKILLSSAELDSVKSMVAKYEKSTVAPIVLINGSNSGITTSAGLINYTRICDLLFFTCFVKLTSKGAGTGTLSISGFPYPVDVTNNALPMCPAHCAAMASTFGYAPNGIFVDSANMQLYYTLAGTATAVASGDMTNTSGFRVSGFYRIAV